MRVPSGHDGTWTAAEIRGPDECIDIAVVTACSDVDPAVPRRRGWITTSRGLGGDGFTAFAAGLGGAKDALSIGRCVRATLDEPSVLEGREIVTGPSIGVARFPADGEDARALLECADIATYRSRREVGRTGCVPRSVGRSYRCTSGPQARPMDATA